MSEGKSVKILTKSSQVDMDGQKNDMEFFVEGNYTEKGQTKYLIYKESEISGMEGTTTTIRIDDDSLSIIRFGSINSKLEFRQGVVTRSVYTTPYGRFDIGIDTKLLEVDIRKDGKSNIKLLYILDTGAEQVITNEMSISFTI
jgi:uncharacterized beta-barrel protein YwiB (DUF1934 family)